MAYKIRDQYGMNYLTFTVVDWIDVFTRIAYKNVIIDCRIWDGVPNKH